MYMNRIMIGKKHYFFTERQLSNLFTVANLHCQLSWYNQIIL